MKTRPFAPLLIRKLAHRRTYWRACCLCLFVCLQLATAAPALAQNQPINLTVAQVRAIAIEALGADNPQLALEFGQALLLANPKDPYAFFILAKAHQLLNAPTKARRAASRAFHFAKTPDEKFAISQLAARLAYEEESLTLAQIWLRRSATLAPTEEHKDQIASDYRRLRAENPWNVHFNFTLAPSSNVNSGSDSAYSIIDGVPVVGLLSRDAQALSGTVAVADITTSYRLHRDERSSLTLLGRLYTRQVFLSAASQRSVPTLENEDFSATTAQAGLQYKFRLGESRNTVALRADIGKNWYGGAPISTFARFTGTHTRALSDATALTLSTSYEHRDPEAGWRSPTKLLGLRGLYRHRLAGGDSISFGLDLVKTESATVNTASTSATTYASYDLGQAIGPAQVSLLLGASYLDYPAYALGFITAPGGRQDTTIFASTTLTFKNLDYAGFIPTLTLRAQRNRSNISRFDTTEVSLTVGIRSRF